MKSSRTRPPCVAADERCKDFLNRRTTLAAHRVFGGCSFRTMTTVTVVWALCVCTAALSNVATVASRQAPSGQLSVRRDPVEWADSVTTHATVWTPVGDSGEL